MSEKITYENELGNIIIFERSKPYFLTGKSGFDGLANNISSDVSLGQIGEIKSNSHIGARALEVDAIISGDNYAEDVDFTNKAISVTNPMLKGTLTYENLDKAYQIDVEVAQQWQSTYDSSTKTFSGKVQFSALYPLWRDISGETEEIQIGESEKMLSFPLAFTDDFIFEKIAAGKQINIKNAGDVPIGFELNATATGTVVNPSILNVYTRENFTFNHTFNNGDTIYINTNDGEKQVLVNGENAYFMRKLGSTFFKLDNINQNVLMMQADSGVENLPATLKYDPRLTGVFNG